MTVRRRLHRWLTASLALLLLPLTLASARHVVVVHWVELRNTPEAIELKVQCVIENFYDLYEMDLESGVTSLAELQRLAPRHGEFLLEHVVLLDDEGNNRPGEVTRVEYGEYPEEGLPNHLAAVESLVFHLRYPIAAPVTQLIVVAEIPESDDQQFYAPLQLVLVAEEIPGEAPHTYVLESQQYVPLQFGAASNPAPETASGPIDSYVFVERERVRWEIVLPWSQLCDWTGLLSVTGGTNLSDQAAVRTFLQRHFSGALRLEIDDVAVSPTVTDFLFFPDANSTRENRDLEVATSAETRAGVSLSFPAVGRLPEQVRCTWIEFPPGHDTITSSFTADFDERQFELRSDQPTYDWSTLRESAIESADLRVRTQPATASVPWASGAALLLTITLVAVFARRRRRWALTLSLGLALAAGLAVPSGLRTTIEAPWLPAVPIVNSIEGLSVFQKLHLNIYRAFDYRSEDEIYDVLARSVDGPLLGELYSQVYGALQLESEGGALCQVDSVGGYSTRVDALEDDTGFRIRSQWEVQGHVTHWGHRHLRSNQYDAEFEVRPRDGQWRITAMETLDEQRTDTEERTVR